MLNSLSLVLLLSISFCIYPAASYSQDWAYIGHSKKPGESIFYIFTLSEKGKTAGELQITQKHVFSLPQKLGDGKPYTSVLITRTLNCSENSISTDKAVFSNGVGSTVGTYENKSSTKTFKKVDESGEIDQFLLNKYCS